MYLIVVYDVDVSRVNSVRKTLRQFLNWIQNSVFEGELAESDFLELKDRLKKITKGEDSIIFFKFKAKYSFEKIIVGKDKSPVDNLI
ncbi:CRISPR-associated endonuclease Cas2 [Candidatus Woesearchaeota archaeon]|nr:CRISPR-associated endonuclease Cas2 [Candidatus Woesearchaeota archaeon]